MTLQEFIRACRELSGLDQEEFARAIGLVSGRSSQSVSNYEQGTNFPSFKVLREIARVAGTSLDQCIVFWDPKLKQTRERENDQMRAILDACLQSAEREQITSYLRGFGVPPPGAKRKGKAPRSRRSKPRADTHGHDDK